ncbi:MAG: hypothetical protein ACLFVJ_12020 [Persicimonas sp.]
MSHKRTMPPPIPGGGDASEAEQTPPGFDDALPLFIIGAVLATALAVMAAARQWLAPWVPLVGALAAGLVLSAAIAFLYCQREQLRTFKLGVLICTAVALPTALWMVGPLRAAALNHFGDFLPETAHQAALDDPSDDVQLSACRAVATGANSLHKEHLVDRLSTSPPLAADCLQPDTEDGLGLSALTHRYTRRFQLAVEDQNTEQVCAAAPYLFSMDNASTFRPTRELTQCAVSATEASMARCCADAITERFDEPDPYVAALGAPDEVAQKDRAGLFNAMVPYAFRNIDASRNELPRLERRLLRDELTQRWLLALGCNSLAEIPSPEELVDGLEAIVDSRGCAMPERGEREVDSWAMICGDLARVEEPTGQLCRAVRHEAVGTAIDVARGHIYSALDAFYSSEASRDIARAHRQLLAAAESSDAPARAIVDGTQLHNLAPGEGNARTREFARGMKRHYPAAAELFAGQVPEPGADPVSQEDARSKARNLHKSDDTDVDSWNETWGKMSSSQREAYFDALADEAERSGR